MNFYCILISGLLGFFIPKCFFYRSDYREMCQKYYDLESKYNELLYDNTMLHNENIHLDEVNCKLRKKINGGYINEQTNNKSNS